MRVVTDKNGMLEMSIINVIFLTNVEKWPISVVILLLQWLGTKSKGYPNVRRLRIKVSKFLKLLNKKSTWDHFM